MLISDLSSDVCSSDLNHVLSQAGASVSIEGGQIRTDEEFWSQIAHQLELGRERVRTESGSQTDTASGGVKFGIPNVAEVNFGGDSAVGRTTERDRKSVG